MPSGTAVVLFNLGGPDRPAAVAPFLFNLFNDPAIIGAPQPIRWALAKFISRKRAPVAREIYEQLGGGSPLLPLTQEQARALREALATDGAPVEVFIAMRYWHPFADQTAAEVKQFDPKRIVLLPLYPQFSTTTTASSLKDWHRAAAKAGLTAPTVAVCCYPTEEKVVAAQAGLLRAAIARVGDKPFRVLFSAHGLPKKIVDRGDPYPVQVEAMAAAVAAAAGVDPARYVVCYQSRVGPLEWIGPETEDELARAGAEKIAVIVMPIAFVSEHSETLVELDITYRDHALAAGVPDYVRVPALGTAPDFIAGLADIVRRIDGQTGTVPAAGRRSCPAPCVACKAA